MHVCWRNVIIVAPHCGDVDIAVEMWGAQWATLEYCSRHRRPSSPQSNLWRFFLSSLCVINVSNVSQHIYPVFFSYFGRAMLVISHLRC